MTRDIRSRGKNDWLPEQAQATAIVDLYRDNTGCKLPCWWGIMPGKTRWEDVLGILNPLRPYYIAVNPFGKQNDVNFVNFRLDQNYYNLFETDLGLKFSGDVVESISTGVDSKWGVYFLPNLLQTYGEPGEVWIYASRKSPKGSFFKLTVYYPDKGILFEFRQAVETRSQKSG
jgi:hypothetical protein